jgi:hypothetical protein
MVVRIRQTQYARYIDIDEILNYWLIVAKYFNIFTPWQYLEYTWFIVAILKVFQIFGLNICWLHDHLAFIKATLLSGLYFWNIL